MARNALGLEFGSATRLSKRPVNVWNCLWGHALKISPGIIRKSRVSYPGPGLLSSATWPSLPKKHYNELTNQPTDIENEDSILLNTSTKYDIGMNYLSHNSCENCFFFRDNSNIIPSVTDLPPQQRYVYRNQLDVFTAESTIVVLRFIPFARFTNFVV